MSLRVAIVVLLASAPAASADRSLHGSLGFGSAFLVTGADDGPRGRLEAELDVEPGGAFGRFGGLVALRAFDRGHHGLLCAGLVFEAAAARPRVVIDLHAEAGADLDVHAPLVGGGLRSTIAIIGPLGVALDSGAYLVIDGVARTRMVISSSALVVARW